MYVVVAVLWMNVVSQEESEGGPGKKKGLGFSSQGSVEDSIDNYCLVCVWSKASKAMDHFS